MAKHTAFPTVSQVRLFTGAPYTGKTQHLLDEIVSLLQAGVAASEMLVFCASPQSARQMSVRLLAQCPQEEELQTEEVVVTTPRAFFLDLLGTQAAYEATGRKARLLLPFEYDMFLEDLKTSGVRPQGLREILKFLYKGLSELANEVGVEEWLITNEERELFDLMQSNLTFTGAILEPELANVAVQYMKDNSGALDRAQKNYVFVDDFALLSRASQVASCLLARNGIILSADKGTSREVYESYPSAEGVDELVLANPHATVIQLTTSYSCPVAAKASYALLQESKAVDGEAGCERVGDEAGLQLMVGEDPRDEITRVADAVERSIQQGVALGDIVVAAPHPAWRRSLLSELRLRSIPAAVLPNSHFLKVDIRSNEGAFPARLLTILNLVADSTDAVAWRCWCGFGDYLAQSNGIQALRDVGGPGHKTFDAVLDAIDPQGDGLKGSDAVRSILGIIQARDEARAIIDRVSGLCGQGLLEALAQELEGPGKRVPEEMQGLLAGEELSAAALTSRARTHLEFPVFDCEAVVKVVSYEDTVGMNPRCLFATGFMNGFFPRHDYSDGSSLTVEQSARHSARDRAHLASMVAKAGDALVVSYCKKLDVESAERLGLTINRIVFEEGRRIAKTQPSIYLKFITDAKD